MMIIGCDFHPRRVGHINGKYNAGFFLTLTRNNWGCATSRAF
jgi:hypothetical protein